MPSKTNPEPVEPVEPADGIDQQAVEDFDTPVPGNVVELHDGSIALLLGTDPQTIVRLGRPEQHDLAVQRVG